MSGRLFMQVPVSLTSPPSPARKSRLPADDRHRQLLRAAIETFARHGFAGTKTKDIALAAGVSEAILFRHFATKEDLYHAILDMRTDHHGSAEGRAAMQMFMDARDDLGLLPYMPPGILNSFG